MRRVKDPPRLPARPKDANKVTVGCVLVVGGSPELVGAPAMAGLGALRAGAGLVKVAVPNGIQPTVAGYRPETTTLGLPQTRGGVLGAAALPVLADRVRDWDAVVLGPGAGRTRATLGLIVRLALDAPRPLLLDADGLFAFNDRTALLRKRKAPTVITPHEGEAARLLGTTSADVRADRVAAAVKLATSCNAVVVLKGPGTLVTDGERLYRNASGGPVLASGGTGDVLAGIGGALLAQMDAHRHDAFQAACAAVFVHGDAADRVAGRRDRGFLATELADGVPDAIFALRRRSRR
jgi:NAD(P)H-hydrate epimerase